MSNYIQIGKPLSLSEVDHKLYWMYANGMDTWDKKPIYREVKNDEDLELCYYVYMKEEV